LFLKKIESVGIKGKYMARTNRMEPTHDYVKTNGLHVTWNGVNIISTSNIYETIFVICQTMHLG
jgi:hypothetical protein